MPTALINSYAVKARKPVAEVEAVWEEAKKIAAKKFQADSPAYWAYVKGIVRRKLKIIESMSFKEFVSV